MQTLQIAILAIFILFQAKVKSQETLEISEKLVNGTIEDEFLVQNSTETRPQQWIKENWSSSQYEILVSADSVGSH